MSIYSIQHADSVGFALSAGDTIFHPLCGNSLPVLVEAEAEFIARVAWTLSDLWISVVSNGITAATTKVSRIAGANGNLTITIPASTSGEFEDTTNTDSISVGQAVNWRIVIGATGSTMNPNINRALIEDTAGDVAPYCVGTGGAGLFSQVTRYQPDAGASLLEAQPLEAQYRHGTAYTSSDLRVFVSSNGLSAASTCTAQPNQVNGNQTITIPASTDGAFADTTNTDSIAATQFFRWIFEAGMGAHNDGPVTIETTESHSDSPTRASIAWGQIDGALAGITEEAALEGDITMGSLAETFRDAELGLAYDIANLYVDINSNDADASTIVVLRIAAADGTLTVTIPTLATGNFEDTTNSDPVLATDHVSLRHDATAVTSGRADCTLHGVELTETPTVAPPPIRPMPQLHPRAAPRAGPDSYWFPNLLAVEERVFPPIRPMDQLHPRAAQRAAPNDYWIDNLLAVEERVFPPIRPMAQLHPRAAPRASPYSYWHDNLLAVEEFPPIQPMPQLLPRAARRRSPLAYWIDNLLAVEERVFPPIRPMDQLHPRAAARAAPYSYWRDNLLTVAEVPLPPIRPMDQLHPRAAPRAAPYSYWIDNLLAVPEIVAVTIELTYVIDVIIGSPAIGFQEKELILKRIFLKVLQLKDLIGPD